MRTFLLFALLAGTFQAAAAETLVTLERDGRPVVNGEVCRFPARDLENPFHRWLASQTMTCVAAGSITLPEGLWNVFGRSDGHLSNPVVIDGSKAPEALSLALTPAATITPLLPAGTTAVFYAPRRGIAFPLAAETNRLLVPAAEDLWAIVLQKGQPAGIVSIPALDAATERAVDLQGNPGGPFVLGWVQIPEADREALRKAQGMSTPRVHLTTAGSTRESDPLPSLATLNGSFVLVRGVTAGDTELDVAGRGWISSRTRVRIDTNLVTTATTPLLARTAASLIVRWSSESDLIALDRGLGSCHEDTRAPLVEISVSACPHVYGESNGDDPPCNVIHQETFAPDLDFGSFRVDDLPPGDYLAELRFGKLPTIREKVTLRALQQQNVSLRARYVEIYGGLTHGGEILNEEATLKFPGGIGFANRETGEYRAVLLRPFTTDARIDVVTCRGNFRAYALASRDCTGNARFDIDIPDNELRINVIDTFTRSALQGARVTFTLMSSARPRRPVVTEELTTTSEGLVKTSVPEREIWIQVTRAGYQKQLVRPFTMPGSGTKTIDVELLPLRGSTGKIVSPRPFERGAVFWFSATGVETEQTDLESDGTFLYTKEHGQDETMAVVSLSHPLWVSHLPMTQGRETTLVRYPDSVSRTFDITIPGTDPRISTYIGVFAGGVRVPFPALRIHQTLRKLPALVRGAGPLRIGEILESGPIEVALGPREEEVPSRVRDPLALPQFATALRTRLLPGAAAIALSR